MVSEVQHPTSAGATKSTSYIANLGSPYTVYVLTVALLLLGTTACGEKEEITASAEAAIEQETPTPPEQLKLYVFNGTIGNYNTDALMNLVFEGDTILGSYYYYKNMGRLALNGNIDPLTNKITLVESYKGKPTGYFRGKLAEQGLSGSWSPNPDFSDSQGFTMQILKISEVGTKPSATLSDASYKLVHGVEMWNMETKKFDKATTTDKITIRFIDDEAFSFHYAVSGHNGHSGKMAGIGKMLNLKQGIFKGEEGCELLFDFYDKRVDINAESCQEYGGQRAYFGGSLKKI